MESFSENSELSDMFEEEKILETAKVSFKKTIESLGKFSKQDLNLDKYSHKI